MSQFEFVSVAVALVHALAVGRLLNGLSPSMETSRRYWVHVGWIVELLIVNVAGWWLFWRTISVEWTAVRFLWAISLPAMVFVRATVLLGDTPASTASFREHFFQKRLRFFAIGVAVGVQVGMTPWVLGNAPWLTVAPAHLNAVWLIASSILGLCSRSPSVHAVIISVQLLSLVFALFAFPELPAA